MSKIKVLLISAWASDLFYPLAHFDNLHGSRLGVSFNASALRPFVGIVMVIDIGQEQSLPPSCG